MLPGRNVSRFSRKGFGPNSLFFFAPSREIKTGKDFRHEALGMPFFLLDSTWRFC